MWTAFFALSTCRPAGMGGPGPIPWTAIRDFGRHWDLRGEAFDDFLFGIRTLDRVWLTHHHGTEGGLSNGRRAR